jgi:hypothetical protein
MGVKSLAAGLAVGAAALAVALPTSEAVAQRVTVRAGAGPMGGMGGMDVTTRSIEAYGRLLGMDKDQLEAAKVLHEGYQEANRVLGEELQQKFTKAQEKMQEQDFQGFQQDMMAAAREGEARRRSIEQQFFADLRAMLTPEQDEKWPRVERHRRREQIMRVPVASGAGADLIAVYERATRGTPQAEPSGEVAAMLERYEVDVDKPLAELKRFTEEEQRKMMEDGGRQMMPDFNRIQEMMKQTFERGAAVRDVNRDYARRIAPMLEGDVRTRFEEEFARRSFPRVYRPAHVMTMMRAAQGFEDLTPEQKDSLDAVLASYRRDAAGLNEAWAKAIEEQEAKSGGTMGVMMAGFMGGGEGAQAVADARKARRDLDAASEARLREILSDAQEQRLPPAPPPTDAMMEMFGGMSEDEE